MSSNDPLQTTAGAVYGEPFPDNRCLGECWIVYGVACRGTRK